MFLQNLLLIYHPFKNTTLRVESNSRRQRIHSSAISHLIMWLTSASRPLKTSYHYKTSTKLPYSDLGWNYYKCSFYLIGQNLKSDWGYTCNSLVPSYIGKKYFLLKLQKRNQFFFFFFFDIKVL